MTRTKPNKTEHVQNMFAGAIRQSEPNEHEHDYKECSVLFGLASTRYQKRRGLGAMPDRDALRTRLFALRADALRQLAEADQIEPGFLALIAGVNAALLALDAEAEPLDAAAVAERVVMAGSGKGGGVGIPVGRGARTATGSSRDFTMKPDHKSFFGK